MNRKAVLAAVIAASILIAGSAVALVMREPLVQPNFLIIITDDQRVRWVGAVRAFESMDDIKVSSIHRKFVHGTSITGSTIWRSPVEVTIQFNRWCHRIQPLVVGLESEDDPIK